MVNAPIPVKLVIVGETSVGKTSIMQVYSEGFFSNNQASTIGATCCEKEVTVNDKNYLLAIWDTAGQENYRTIVPMYFRDTSVAIVVFDVTNQKSFEAVTFWVKTIRENLGDNASIALCSNKIDLEEKRVISDDDIFALASSLNIPVFFTSAATGFGISSLFYDTLSMIDPKEEEDEKVIKTVDCNKKVANNNCSC